MSTTSKKTYVYKMNLLTANILCILILILAGVVAIYFKVNIFQFNKAQISKKHKTSIRGPHSFRQYFC